MNNPSRNKKNSLISRLISSFSNEERLEAEKARLQAFLAAFPGEYCGFSPDGSAAYSFGFCDMLGLEHITGLADIQNQLSAEDSAALEGHYSRLTRSGVPFTLHADRIDRNGKTRYFKLSGSQGHDLKGGESYQVIWIEDITKETEALEEQVEAQESQLGELERIQSALNSIPRPVWLRNANHDLIWCNWTYCDYLGSDLETITSDQKELAAQAMRKKSSPGDEKKLLGKDLARAAAEEGIAKDATVHGTFHGKRLLLRISEIPLSVNMTMGIAYNITREEELENRLKRYQSSHHELLEHLHSAIAIFTGDERLEFYNAAFSQLWHLEGSWLDRHPKLGEIMEKLREMRRLPEQADFRAYKQSWREMFTSLIDTREDMLHLPDGSTLRMTVIPHSMDGLMMIFEDVTSRLALESSYNTLVAVQKETLDNLGEAVAAFGSDGRLKLYNPAFAKLWCLNPEDLDGEPHITRLVEKRKPLFPEEDWATRKEQMITNALDRSSNEGRLELVGERLLDYATVPLPDGGVLLTYIDITDKVQVEKALREKNQALETAEQLKLDFLANVSYQLRTPLNAIMGFNEILQQQIFGALNDKQQEYTHDIGQASEKLLELINDILDLSTLEAGYLDLERGDMDISKMLHGVYELVHEWARKRSLNISLMCDDDIGVINADERRIKQALVNLVRNAIDHTPNDGNIAIRATRDTSGLTIAVTDSGIGISPEDQKRIFSPFARAGSSKQTARLSKGGAGLGLSLVKNIVTLHGGSVTLESKENEGTTATIFLPSTSVPTALKIPLGEQA